MITGMGKLNYSERNLYLSTEYNHQHTQSAKCFRQFEYLLFFLDLLKAKLKAITVQYLHVLTAHIIYVTEMVSLEQVLVKIPTPVAARYKAWICGHSLPGTVG